MSFFSQRVVRYLINQFQYYLLFGYIKTAAVFKCQWFKYSKSEKTKPKVSKRQHICENGNKKGQSLDKYKYESEKNIKDIFSFLFFFLFLFKRSQTAWQIWAKKDKAQFISYIYPKSAYLIIANFALVFLGREWSKVKKHILAIYEKV